ncbi:MAG: lectin [Candidatus Neomarinimicrobiota bacterium]|nr:MAG: lectin [Candidatus Neomarinimicrobiota bacterium]
MAVAQQDNPPMTFFVTSVGMGNGADLNGLIGADAHCQSLAVAAGAGDRTWHAYLSTGPPISVNARGRIGGGPWHNHAGTRMIADDPGSLHGDTLDEARLGNQINQAFALTENGDTVPSIFGRGDGEALEHDILTGSQPDGRAFTDGEDHTCSNWTSSVAGEGSAQLGHSDKTGGGNGSWNSSHPSRGCSQDNLTATGGSGRFYCFAIN